MKYPTFPTIIDDCLRISISDLKGNHLLEWDNIAKGELHWPQGSSITVCVNTKEYTMTLEYTYQQEHRVSYTVFLACKPSNLGIGVLWYFKCPKTAALCRKLYFYNGYFVGRKAIPHAMYRKQTESKSMRYLGQLFTLANRIEKSRYEKLHYRNKPTPNAGKYERLQERLQKASLLRKGNDDKH